MSGVPHQQPGMTVTDNCTVPTGTEDGHRRTDFVSFLGSHSVFSGATGYGYNDESKS